MFIKLNCVVLIGINIYFVVGFFNGNTAWVSDSARYKFVGSKFKIQTRFYRCCV